MSAPRPRNRLAQSIPARPLGLPLMHMQWGSLLFAHWPIGAALLRPLIPARLEIDEFEGTAWVGVVPFTMWGIRATCAPPIPGLSAFHEVNVRTYVTLDGVPGVWFFSLDAANRIAVAVARKSFHLPYFNAKMTLRQSDGVIEYSSQRVHRGAPAAELDAAWTPGARLSESRPGSLEYFLTERYCLYAAKPLTSARPGLHLNIVRSHIFHRPWTLQRADLHHWRSTMIGAHGIPEPRSVPLLHHSEHLGVEAWRPESVER